MHLYYVYILRCSDGSYYTGVTNGIERRVLEHHQGKDATCYTYTRRPLELVHVEYFTDIRLAIDREKQIKRWSRAKKLALIQQDSEALKLFSADYYTRKKKDA